MAALQVESHAASLIYEPGLMSKGIVVNWVSLNAVTEIQDQPSE